MQSGKWIPWAAAFDFHGDYHSPKTKAAFLKFLKDFKPVVRVFGGDLWDFRALRNRASEDERRESMLADFAEGKLFLEEFKPQWFLRGNHDERLWLAAESQNGIIADAATNGVNEIEKFCEKLGCIIRPYHKSKGYCTIGNLTVMHGFDLGGINALRAHAQIYGSCLIGHFHRAEELSVPFHRQPLRAWISPALCKLDMEYASRHPRTLSQKSGWAWGYVNLKTGEYKTFLAVEENGSYFLPTNFKEL